MLTSTEAHKTIEQVKEKWREAVPGGCKILTLGSLCPCVLCLCDRLHDFIVDLEKSEPARTE